MKLGEHCLARLFQTLESYSEGFKKKNIFKYSKTLEKKFPCGDYHNKAKGKVTSKLPCKVGVLYRAPLAPFFHKNGFCWLRKDAQDKALERKGL